MNKDEEKARFTALKRERRNSTRTMAVFTDPKPGATHAFPGSGDVYRRMADGSLRKVHLTKPKKS